jgi:hypothetical protein
LERIGDPLDDGVLYGPLHNQQAVDAYKAYISALIIAILYKKNIFTFFILLRAILIKTLKRKKNDFLLI